MINAAVILLIHASRLPLVALVIPLRDLFVLIATPLAMGRGYRFEVNRLGKAATWLLYASLGFIMATHHGASWPLWVFWTGLALAFVSLAQYFVKARRELT
jgi:phosphatidylglycerophosphate synthase